MFGYVNSTLHVTLVDGRQMTGTFLAYDKHMNVVLSDVVESHPLSRKAGDATRSLGLVLVRGEHVVSVRAERRDVQLPVPGPTATGVALPSARPVLPGGGGVKAKE